MSLSALNPGGLRGRGARANRSFGSGSLLMAAPGPCPMPKCPCCALHCALASSHPTPRVPTRIVARSIDLSRRKEIPGVESLDPAWRSHDALRTLLCVPTRDGGTGPAVCASKDILLVFVTSPTQRVEGSGPAARGACGTPSSRHAFDMGPAGKILRGVGDLSSFGGRALTCSRGDSLLEISHAKLRRGACAPCNTRAPQRHAFVASLQCDWQSKLAFLGVELAPTLADGDKGRNTALNASPLRYSLRAASMAVDNSSEPPADRSCEREAGNAPSREW